MIKYSHPLKKEFTSSQKQKIEGTLSLFDFFKQAKTTVIQRSEAALSKLHNKITEEQSVFVLPLQNRKKLSSKERSIPKQDKSLSRPKQIDLSKPHGHLSKQNTERISELLKKKHELMSRLRKIDHQLHIPSLLPVTIESNGSFNQNQFQKGPNFRGMDSRLNLNFKQSNTYNLVQHERSMEMLTRINHQKMKRQQKIVSSMKRKQEIELKKLEEMQKNQSRMQLERQSRILPVMRGINKKQTEKLRETDSAEQTTKHYRSFQKQKEQEIKNEFDDVSDIQIGSSEKIPTESNRDKTIENEP